MKPRRSIASKVYGKNRHKLQVAPLVDVVFQLLIFFLVACEVRPTEADFRTNLPGSGMGPANRKEQKTPEIVRVFVRNRDADGNAVDITLNGNPLAGDAFQELESRLRSAAEKTAKTRELMLIIDGDPTVKLKFISRVLDSGVAAGVPKITFGRPDKPKGLK